MVVLLNARATALLNVFFHNLTQSKHIVKLASLAVCLFTMRKSGSDTIEGNFSDEEKVWMLERMIQLVRDDIYALLVSVSQDHTPADRTEQQQHVDILRRTVTMWQRIINKHVQAARGHNHQFESRDGYPDRMATLRAKCEQ
jgi:hypothetical protein